MSNNIPKIDISPEQWDIVRDILQKHVPQYQVRAFGSRAKWTAKPYSDLDLAIITDHPLDLAVSASLSDDFSESDLPWRVDLVDWAATSESFRGVIEGDKVVVQGEWKSKWPIANLKDIVSINTSKIDVEMIKLEKYISTENMLPNFCGIQIASSKPESGKITAFKKGDILFSNIRTYFKKLWLAEWDGACSNDVIVFRPNASIPSGYVYHVLMNQSFIDYTVKTSKGTKMPRGDKGAIMDYQLMLAPVDARLAISDYMICIRNKITLNNQTNQTLEQMAQTLFKSWFVDFDPVIDNALDVGNTIPEPLQQRAALRQKVRSQSDFKPLPDDIRQLFPNQFVESELGWVPEGWEIVTLDKLIMLIGGGTPKTSIEEYWDGDIPWFSVVDAPNDSDIFVIDTEKHVSLSGIDNSSTKILRQGTTIISARGTVGKCALVATPMAMNQSCYGIVGIDGISDEFIYYTIRDSVQKLQQRSHGSVFSTVTRDTFKTLNIVFSGILLTHTYSKYVTSMFDRVLSNNYQTTTLTQLRDTLLPKLISGELSLTDIDLENS